VLVTISTTYRPATDLGFLLHKNPARAHPFDSSFGQAHVFYPEAGEDRCTAALLLEVDPIRLVRGAKGRGSPQFALGQYVNDRPYAASSLLAVALGKVFGTAMRGRSDARPELAAAALPLEIGLPALPCRGGAELAGRLFGPLGWEVDSAPVPLDPAFPDWGDSRYLTLRLRGELRLATALNHVYVLLPVLDDGKHYWVSPDEVEKLVRAGAGWLHDHPERSLITRRYLAHSRSLTRTALARLAEVDDTEPEALDDAIDEELGPEQASVPGSEPGSEPGSGHGEPPSDVAETPDRPVPLAEQRRGAVVAVLKAEAAHRVLDLGCGSGALVDTLLRDPAFTEVVGTDVSHRALTLAARRLRLDRMAQRQRDRVQLFQSALTYRDARLRGYDAAVLMEVVEHVDPPRLPSLEQAVFGAAQPRVVVVTTPNAEHNVRYESLPAGAMRHHDHRFEWTREQFRLWADAVAERHGYRVRYLPVGADDPEVGPPTQMAVFNR
jgi:SAM-dependent methyltransferase